MDKQMDELSEIQNWYLQHCDGDWEHGYGLHIGTLDNPGWTVEINLEETGLEDKPFMPVEKGVGAESIEDDQDWYSCKVKDKKFTAACGPLHLRTVLRVFLDWSKTNT
jgi:hypothetical protein